MVMSLNNVCPLRLLRLQCPSLFAIYKSHPSLVLISPMLFDVKHPCNLTMMHQVLLLLVLLSLTVIELLILVLILISLLLPLLALLTLMIIDLPIFLCATVFFSISFVLSFLVLGWFELFRYPPLLLVCCFYLRGFRLLLRRLSSSLL